MLAGAWLIYFCFGLSIAAMAPLVPRIASELQLSHTAMGGVLGAWPLVFIASAVPCGVVLDRLGLRWSLAVGAGFIGLSGILRALATDHLSLYLAVAVFGVGGPLVSVGIPKLVSVWFSGNSRALAMGICVTGPAFGTIVALSLTNGVVLPLVDGRWRAALVVYAAFVLLAGAAWLAIAARAGAGEAAPGATRASQLVVFAALLRARPVQITLAVSIGIFFFNHGLNNWLPEILRAGGMDPTAAGYWASIPTVVGLVGALVIPRLAAPARRLTLLAGLVACAAVATTLIDNPGGPWLVLGLVLQGVARGSMMTLAMLVLMDLRTVGAGNVGAAGGLFFAAAEIGGVLGPLTIGAMYDWTGGFGRALDALTLVCLGLMLLLWPLARATAPADARLDSGGRRVHRVA